MQSIFAPGLFTDRVALVTGGGTGIGLAIASELRLLGAHVVIASRRQANLDAGLAALDQVPGPGACMAQVCNIREGESVHACVDAVMARFGVVDLLVNNGGGQFPAPASAITERGWRAVMETNLTGTFLMSQAVAATAMHRGGAMVNIIAQMANGFPMMAHTGAARAGVENLTRTLAFEWAPQGIRVNALAPGVIASSGADNYTPEQREFFFGATAHIPAARLGTPQEVAAGVLYLLSPAAGFVTGTTLWMDGGERLYGHAAAGQMKEMMQHSRPPAPWPPVPPA
jgi:NAD(P)-dependent dehydrogenase (short-subunit alcohol dehydrogenase family)